LKISKLAVAGSVAEVIGSRNEKEIYQMLYPTDAYPDSDEGFSGPPRPTDDDVDKENDDANADQGSPNADLDEDEDDDDAYTEDAAQDTVRGENSDDGDDQSGSNSGDESGGSDTDDDAEEGEFLITKPLRCSRSAH
jgi:hypothetical protein